MSAPSVSIVIPTLNAARWLPDLFDAFSRQQPSPPDEVVIVDSGSTDGTLRLANANPVVRVIPISDFTHGGSRNVGIRAATSDVVVLMTQDAEPANDQWLARLVAPLVDLAVAGVYARQIPRPDASPMEQYFLLDRFPPGERVTRTHQGAQPPVYPQTFFSNVSSAALRETWLKFPFDETLLMSEDQQFARDALMAGFSIVYEPESMVVHSHNYTLKQTFQRYFDSVVAFRQVSSSHTLRRSARLGGGAFVAECSYILSRHPDWLPYFGMYQAMRATGAFLGQLEPWMPRTLCARLSLHSAWWQRPSRPKS